MLKNDANSVRKISKDIYVIKNDINLKVYVGQSVDPKKRFESHCKKNKDNSLIDKAIQKYGKEHFWYEVLEEKIQNYNEREKYWIKKYNSLSPNGYNILSGGDEPPCFYGEKSSQSKMSNETFLELKKDLKNTLISFGSLGEKYNLSKRQIMRINSGVSRAEINENYPLRKVNNINGKLTDEDVDLIIDLLKYSYRLNGDIARQFGVSSAQIERINQGKAHFREQEKYPIRKWKSCGKVLFTYEQVSDIIYLLLYTKQSISSIAKKYNVSFNSITQINQGTSKKYKREGLKYPLRPY